MAKLKELAEGQPYTPGEGEYVILPESSIEDVLRHLLSEVKGGKFELLTILELLKEE
jgi:hypothetical protein